MPSELNCRKVGGPLFLKLIRVTYQLLSADGRDAQLYLTRLSLLVSVILCARILFPEL